VFDCVRFAENENDIVVDRGCISNGLRTGADLNWINREAKRHTSTLSHYVTLISLSGDSKVIAEGIHAVKALIDGGAKLQPIDAAILFFPISQGNTVLVQLLLSLGASPSTWPKDEIGTALNPAETAAANGNQEIVELLVKHGAMRPDPKDALQSQFVRTARYGTQQDLSQLLSQGAIVNGKTQDEETALINSIWSIGVSDCEALAKIRWLLMNGADPNLPGKGMLGTGPALHQAAWFTGLRYQSKKTAECAGQILRELVKRGAHIAGRDALGRTPLHIAAASSNVYAARLFLEYGSTVMPRDNRGRTPLDVAESGEMINLLRQRGATER
jgi:hypothetical protein